MKYLVEKEVLYFYFTGDFDYLEIQTIKQEVILILNETSSKKVVFDLEDIKFIDSTGIGFILARYKQLHKQQKLLLLSNISSENKVILAMSGVFQIIDLIKSEVKP